MPDDDSTLRPITNAAQTATRRATGAVLSWLPTAKRCECGAVCKATYEYDAQEAAFFSDTNGERPAWKCEACGTAYRREEKSRLSFDIWGRGE